MPVRAVRGLTARAGLLLASFVALLLGSAVLSVCGILLESGLHVGHPPERYAAADVVVAGRQQAPAPHKEGNGPAAFTQPLPERVPVPAVIARRLAAAVPAAAVVTDTGVSAQVIAPGGTVVAGANGAPTTGHNWSSTRMGRYRLLSGRAPAGEHQVVLDEQLARRARAVVGDTVPVMTRSIPRPFTVSGIVTLTGVTSPRQSAVFFSDGLTRRLAARPDTVDALGVLAPAGRGRQVADAVARTLDDHALAVFTGTSRGRAEFLDVATTGFTLVVTASALAGNTLLVTVFVVAGTLSLALSHRRSETALLRAVGATPAQIRRKVTRQALVVACAGAVLGWPLGVAVVHRMWGHLAGHGFVPPGLQPVIGPLPAAGALVTAVLSACTAAAVAARRAGRVRPAQALGHAAVERRDAGRGRVITGGVLAAGAAGLFVTGLTHRGDFTTLVGTANALALLTVIAASVLGPLVSRAAMLVLGPLLRTSRVSGCLAAAHHRARPRNLAAAATPLILAVSFAATAVFAQTTALQASREQLHDGLLAGHVLTAAQGIPADVAGQVRRLPQVRAATGVVHSTVLADGARTGTQPVPLSAQGVDAAALDATVDLTPRHGSLKRLGPHTLALSTVASSRLGRGVGDTVRLRLGDGTPLASTVVAVYARGLGFADITLDHDLLLTHTTAHRDQYVLAATTPAAGGGRDAAAALAEVAARYPGTVVRHSLTGGDQMRQQEANAWVNYLLAGLILAYAGVTVVNTQVMNTAARRGEFALLRLGGMTTAQVMRMMRWESLTVVLTGVGTGTLASLPPLVLVSLALTGHPWPTVPAPAYLAIAGTTTALAVTATLTTARIVLRTPPARAAGPRP